MSQGSHTSALAATLREAQIPGFSVEMKQLILDPQVPAAVAAIAFAMPPTVEAKVKTHGKGVAYISASTAGASCGMSSPTFEEHYSNVPSLVQEAPGRPYKLRRTKSGEYRNGGFAPAWSLASPVELAPVLIDQYLSPKEVGAFFDPSNKRWSPRQHGGVSRVGWRLLVALLVLHGGVDDIEVSVTELASMLGTTWKTANLAKEALAASDLGPYIDITGPRPVFHLALMLKVMTEAGYGRVEPDVVKAERTCTQRRKWVARFLAVKGAVEEFLRGRTNHFAAFIDTLRSCDGLQHPRATPRSPKPPGPPYDPLAYELGEPDGKPLVDSVNVEHYLALQRQQADQPYPLYPGPGWRSGGLLPFHV